MSCVVGAQAGILPSLSKTTSENMLALLDCADSAAVWLEEEGRAGGTPSAIGAGREKGFALGSVNEYSFWGAERALDGIGRWACEGPADGAENTAGGLLKTGGCGTLGSLRGGGGGELGGVVEVLSFAVSGTPPLFAESR